MRLQTSHLCYSYTPQNTVLHDVALKVDEGEKLFVLGPNGSGKTTLLSCLAGILTPDQGEIQLNDRGLGAYKAAERAQIIGVIPQGHNPAFPYTVMEMVMMGRAPYLRWLDLPSKDDQNIVEMVLEQLGLFDLRDHPYTEISGGEQQLTLIARGLAQKCQILLMDEPTAHLDLSNQYKIMEIIDQLSQSGISFVISSHQPNEALHYADNVMVMNQGWVIENGPPEDIVTEAMISTVFGISTEVLYSKEGHQMPRALVPRRTEQVRPGSLIEPNGFLNEILVQSQQSPQLLLLTGLKGIGKTTWCLKLIQIAEQQGIEMEGIVSPGVYSGGKKTGIEIINVQSGKKRLFAELNPGEKQGISTPRWSFDPDSIAWANEILTTRSESELLIIDELGPLELLRGEGFLAGLSRIDSREFQLAIVVVRPSLLPKALQRWSDAQVIRGVLK
jgi:ABC-type cobalamin/Fe3+-siderophores transport system ATPase subunit